MAYYPGGAYPQQQQYPGGGGAYPPQAGYQGYPGAVGMQGMQGMQAMQGMQMQPGMQGGYYPGGPQGGVGVGVGVGVDPRTGVPGGHAGGAWLPANLGYEYTLPNLGYVPQPTMTPYDLAREAYSAGAGTHSSHAFNQGILDRVFGNISVYYKERHLKEREARKAHRRIYYNNEYHRNSKHFGGAAAYQAYLIWDRDHWSIYHSFANDQNRQRLVALAVAEVYALFDRLHPADADREESCEWASATAKHLFDLHYDLGHSSHTGSRGGLGGTFARAFGGGEDSDLSDTDGDYRRRANRERERAYRANEAGGYYNGAAGAAGYPPPPGYAGAGGVPGAMPYGAGQPGYYPGAGAGGMPGAYGMPGQVPGYGMPGAYGAMPGAVPGAYGMQGGMPGYMPQMGPGGGMGYDPMMQGQGYSSYDGRSWYPPYGPRF